jgi:hypothetical protein
MDGEGCLSADTILDPRQQPFLDHHRIDGVPVLPGVMGIELLCELAGLPLPGHRPVAIEDVEFASPVKFYRDEPRPLKLTARFAEQGDDFSAACRLIGTRTLVGQSEPQVTTHFTARVWLGRPRGSSTSAATTMPIITPTLRILGAADIRKVYFHGPSFQVLEAAWTDGRRVIGRFAGGIPDAHVPSDAPLVTSPRLIELCFQTAGVFELGTSGRLALPAGVARIELLADPGSGQGPFFAVVTPIPDGRGFDAEVLDSKGRKLIQLLGYRTIASPIEIDSSLLAPFRALFGEDA